ncbi:MAG: hypothetical protein K6E37_05765 [Bacteroidales bacterium]|nr:hypothetical protein [Bacteroidales bacterium]
MKRILCFIAVLLLCSCSVKENRSFCPCELLVYSEEPLKTDGSVLVSVIQDGEVVKQGMMSREDFEGGNCRLTVPRRPSQVTVFTGIKDMNAVSGRLLNIRFEHQCDEVYSSSDLALLETDAYDCQVTPHKNYARLFLTIIGLPDAATVAVSSNVKGYDIVSLDPCEGLFQCSPDKDHGEQEFLVRLPRQLNDGMSLDVLKDGSLFRSVPIGMMIAATGYSYDDLDLLDVSLTVDLSKSYVFVTVAGWETESYPIIEY